MTKQIGHILGHPVSKFKRVPDNSLAIPDCMIGVEFEFEGVKPVPQISAAVELPFWAVKDDHSLRGGGKEFVFKEPMFGVDATTALTSMVEYGTKHKFSCNIRTGLHVHLDCRDMGVDALRSMCLAYAVAEPFIYKWIGDNREESNFCIPWYYSEEALSSAVKILNALVADEKEPVGNSKAATMAYQRYAGFNMNSLDRFGSVEFRHMQTCLNLKRILDWVNIILTLKKTAISHNPEELYYTLMRSTPDDMLRTVFGNYWNHLYSAGVVNPKDLLAMGRESAVTLYGGTLVKGGHDRYGVKNTDKFKGLNSGLQKFRGRKAKKGEAKAAADTEEIPVFVPPRQPWANAQGGLANGWNNVFVARGGELGQAQAFNPEDLIQIRRHPGVEQDAEVIAANQRRWDLEMQEARDRAEALRRAEAALARAVPARPNRNRR